MAAALLLNGCEGLMFNRGIVSGTQDQRPARLHGRRTSVGPCHLLRLRVLINTSGVPERLAPLF